MESMVNMLYYLKLARILWVNLEDFIENTLCGRLKQEDNHEFLAIFYRNCQNHGVGLNKGSPQNVRFFPN